MSYHINFGYLNYVSEEILDKLVDGNESDKGIGLHRIFPEIGFDKLDNNELSRDDREHIINNYHEHVDSFFHHPDIREEGWVSDSRLNSNRGYPNRSISADFMENFKKEVKGGREFFRSIKDSYTDNGTHPNTELVLINTPSFKNSLRIMAREALFNDTLEPEQIDFIKWFYWWGTKVASKKKNFAAIKFFKN